MATQTRIYIVSPNRPDSEADPVQRRLVRASHPSHALRHVAAEAFNVAVASQDDLVALLGDGVEVENIKAEPAEEAPQ